MTGPGSRRPRQVLFVQGGGAGTHDEWDNRLVESLRRTLGEGGDVRYPRMPDEDDPGAATWVPAIREALARLDDGAVVVGHSVGGTLLVRALSLDGAHPASLTLGAIVLIAAPFVGAGGWPSDEFAFDGTLGSRLPAGVPVHLDEMTDDPQFLADRFEAHRPHLRGVAYRMLGSVAEADDAVQEAWLRLARAETSDVENLRAWLTTVVARVCLNQLRARRARRETPLEPHVADPIVAPPQGGDPEYEALLGDSVGLALLAVLETLTPAERVAFVLHDVFAVPFEEVAQVVGRTPAATRQLASRGRRRVRGAPVPDTGLEGQWAVVEAFLAASRDGDFERLLEVLDPDVVLRSDGGEARPRLGTVLRGRDAVASGAMTFRALAAGATRALVNGVPGGIVRGPDGRVFSVLAFTVAGGRIVAVDVLADPDRLARLELGVA